MPTDPAHDPANDPGATRLHDHLRVLRGGLLLVVTGAGVSLASGIPTFRGTDPDAVWARDVMDLGTHAFYRRDPAASWRWYLERFDRARLAHPNPAHHALATLERWHVATGGSFLLVTQNVDLLHEAAGSEALIKVHGSLGRVRCATRGCALAAPRGSMARDAVDFSAFLAEPRLAHLPTCPACGGLLRQHVLWFDERYDDHVDYQFLRVCHAASQADLVVFIGTSFAVGVTAEVLRSALARRTPVFSIDPAGLRPDPRVEVVRAPAEALLPALVDALTRP